MQSLSIGIPVLRDAVAALNRAQCLREYGFDGPVTISVNDCARLQDSWIIRGEELGLKIVSHPTNLGLYGNFRWLLAQCETDLFLWQAVDDEIPRNFLNFLKTNSVSEATILVTSVAVFVDGEQNLPTKTIKAPFRDEDPFRPHPSAIFGLWNSRWLKENFPRADFDWLDTFILSKAYFSRNAILSLPSARTYGFGRKPPHRVNGRFHLPWGWFFRSVVLLFSAGGPSRSSFSSFLKASRNRFSFSLGEFRLHITRRWNGRSA